MRSRWRTTPSYITCTSSWDLFYLFGSSGWQLLQLSLWPKSSTALWMYDPFLGQHLSIALIRWHSWSFAEGAGARLGTRLEGHWSYFDWTLRIFLSADRNSFFFSPFKHFEDEFRSCFQVTHYSMYIMCIIVFLDNDQAVQPPRFWKMPCRSCQWKPIVACNALYVDALGLTKTRCHWHSSCRSYASAGRGR